MSGHESAGGGRARPPVEVIAHRAGNLAATIPPAIAVADAIELDVHIFRGRLEVRHAKVVWPFSILWERWELLPGDTPRPSLASILDAVPEGTHLWLDLKGFSGRLCRRALREIGARRPLTVSSRSWWSLRRPRRMPGVRVFRSVGTRWQLWAVERVRFGGADDGIVLHERFVTGDVVERLHRLTPTIVAWAVDDIDRALALVDLGISGVIVDDLELISEIRRCTADRT